MKLIIDIPKNFEKHFYIDRFEVSFHRLFADVHSVAGLYERELVVMLIESFKKAKAIDDATMNELTKARWIPCSERQPDLSGYYLVTEKGAMEPDFVTVGCYYRGNTNLDDKWLKETCYPMEARAWMELPQPYRGDD